MTIKKDCAGYFRIEDDWDGSINVYGLEGLKELKKLIDKKIKLEEEKSKKKLDKLN